MIWARKYRKCTRCKRQNIEHEAKGLCKSCYAKRYNKKSAERVLRKRFDGKRDVVLKRDKRCVICKRQKREKLRVHHIDEDKLNNTIENLVTLCNGCHSKLHAYLRLKKFFNKYSFVTDN